MKMRWKRRHAPRHGATVEWRGAKVERKTTFKRPPSVPSLLRRATAADYAEPDTWVVGTVHRGSIHAAGGKP